jgi:polar amino acid transport system substrate-binding protein
MKRAVRNPLSALVLVLLAPAAVLATSLTAYTEEWAPYNYSEDGTVKGIATEVLRAACEESRLDCKIIIVPWARALNTVTNTPNTLIYTIARTPAREDEFLWVGPLLPRSVWIYTRPGHEGKILAELRFGVVRDDATGPDLIAAGVPASAIVSDTSNPSVLRMYRRAMVDAMVDTEIGMAWNLRNAAMPANSVVRQGKLSEVGAYYFAFNRQSDPLTVRALQQALDKIKHDGTLETIKKKYLD